MFYIQPPRGVVALNTLESCVFTRLEYLGLLHNNDTDSFEGDFEYLLEGSTYDRVGHFTLRLLTSTSNDLWTYWTAREGLLLEHRLRHITAKQLLRMFRSIVRQVEVRGTERNLIDATLLKISTHFLQPNVFHHIVADEHAPNCEAFRLKLRFELVPDLVQTRVVELQQGFVVVFCSKWRELLLSLSQTLLLHEKLKLRSRSIQNMIMDDPRLNAISQRIDRQLLKEGITTSKITTENIDSEARKFPPCMSHLHTTLRQRHRLSHHARFQYSLFLKECGMQMDQAMLYWKQEYSKEHTCSSICSHNWKTDERKFIYSIRHLYGLEGSRRNYRTPNCNAICNESQGPRYEGGCPFNNFDRDTLRKFMPASMKESEAEEYLNTFSMQKPEDACTTFFRMRCKINNSSKTIISPVQYYTMMMEADKLIPVQ